MSEASVTAYPETFTPRLRAVNVEVTVVDGQQMAVIRDQRGLSSQAMAIPVSLVPLLELLDGQRSIEQVTTLLGDANDRAAMTAFIGRLCAQLDKCHLLESPAFTAWMQERRREFEAGTVRPLHSAAGYGQPEQRQSVIAEILQLSVAQRSADGLIAPRSSRVPASRLDVPIWPIRTGERLLGVVAPHLDFERGLACYRDAYTLLPPRDGKRRRFIILGTNHHGEALGTVATDKHFDTFVGVIETDIQFVEALNAKLGEDLRGHQFDHLAEHSIELQAVLLAEKYGAENVTMVPLLCHDPTAEPEGGPTLKQIGESIGELVKSDSAMETIILASADFSHVGSYFDDSDPTLDEEFMARIELADREVLDRLTAQSPEAVVRHQQDTGNWTRMCSIGTLCCSAWASRSISPSASFELLRYHQAVNNDIENGVTCAAMVIKAKA